MNREKNHNVFVRFALAFFFLFCFISIVTLRVRLNDLQEQLDEWQASISEYEYRLEELNYEYSLDEDEYIERYARLNGYRMPGEIFFQADD